jgi:predicted SprT family Zn-dependent metalloprotease
MTTARPLRPLAFHQDLAETLQKHEPGLWRWFASDDYGKKYADNVKLELLRSTYRLPREAHERLYAVATEVAAALDVTAPLTLYQAQGEGALNAGLVFVPAEAHVVLQGPVLETLAEAELRALFGHELAHHRLWTEEGQRFHTTDALIEHIVRQPGSTPSHAQSALRMRRWTELYADRGSLLASDDLDAAVACLVKMSTGLRAVDARAYLAQADEALTASEGGSQGQTHPESFLRAFALAHWQRGDDEARLRALVEGALELETLDLVQQEQLTDATRRLLGAVLAPAFMRTEATLTHARRFFPDVNVEQPSSPLDGLLRGGASVDEYYAYLLLDFAMSDPDLEDTALAHAAHLGRQLGLEAVLPKVARKELRLSAASYAELERKGAQLAASPPTASEGAAS